MTDQVIQYPLFTVLVSWLGSGFLSALVAGAYNLRAKRNEYVNDYYKTVIARRIVAYEKLEGLIIQLKAAVAEKEDSRPYHLMFSSENDEDWQRGWMLLHDVMSQGLWFSDGLFSKLRELNILTFHYDKPSSVIEFGKKNYKALALLRDELETMLARDMLDLHDVARFLKSKQDRPHLGFTPTRLNT
jgi:hypothetical protein